MKPLKHLFYLFALVFLTACDGDSFTGKDEEGTDPTQPTTTIEVEIDNTSLSATSPATVTATVKSNGEAQQGVVVSFDSDIALFDVESATALTNSNGIAIIGLIAGDVQGAGSVTASIDTGESATVGFESAGDGASTDPSNEGSDNYAVTVLLDIDRVSIDKLNPATLTATVLDGSEPLVGDVVTFSSTLGNLDPASGTALTDANGVATIMLTAGDVKGAGTVTATSSSGQFNTIGFATEGDQVSAVTVDVIMVEPGTMNEISVINATTPGQLIATVIGISDDVIVTFSSDLGEIPIPTAITDENNQAIVDIYAGNALGADTVSASLKDGETGEKLIVIGATDLQMGSGDPFTEGVAELSLATVSAGGTTVVTVDIKDDMGNVYNLPVDVEFSSNCAIAGTAALGSPVTTSNGSASSTYLAQGCIGDDPINVSANAGGVNLTATVNVNVLAADAGSIEFVSASPENISLRGVGGTESSTVKFRVLDVNGNPVPNTLVDFGLNTDLGGVALDPIQATTDSNGVVQTVVNSGTVSTSVRVTATINGLVPAISSQSSLLVISTGIPDQDSFTLSAETLNPEGWDVDGTEVAITARLADAFNNPAPDGTAVSFTTEGGSIEPSCVIMAGACTVVWTSQAPHPTGPEDATPAVINPIDLTLGNRVGGRATILAHAIGEESFVDLNGNGRFDGSTVLAGHAQTELQAFQNNNDISGNPYDLPEAFVDHNEDGVFDRAVAGAENETYIDFDNSGTYEAADTIYNGSLCAEGLGEAEGCADQTSLTVRGEIRLVMSGSEALWTQNGDGDADADPVNGVDNDGVVNIQGENSAWASVVIADLHNQPMPQGTVVEFTATAGSIVGPDSFVWPNENRNGGRAFQVTIEGEDEPKTGSLLVEVTTPSGHSTVFTAYPIVISAVP
ncbi:hypothetical protein E2K93_01985 [Thalassotalea sp. HSM 43]|uniref:Ig-like domain-containing protein n=1 Tax=Thalassotalea sp. HSM 43 TaxID=2552945 RepID=UPI001080C2FA|nr:invasin domain 3-containing protein [Thalassotalea sp. HSM 43]QBY03212.1 hypothetical protein E2K93_01985 [Thalassotalea sp. HSM 43]